MTNRNVTEFHSSARPHSQSLLSILIVHDEELRRSEIGTLLERLGHVVRFESTALEALGELASNQYDLVFVKLDLPQMNGLDFLKRVKNSSPTLSVALMAEHGSLESAVEALRLGAQDFLTKPINQFELEAVMERTIRARILEKEHRRLSKTIRSLKHQRQSSAARAELIGDSHATKMVRKQISLAVRAECDTILITGETGTGKEVVAREIHSQYGGRHAPFIAVSCPAIPDTLLEGELFGREQGAFTDASESRAGCFELADKGILFLDEVADLSLSAQAKLLRALETRTIRRIGGNRDTRVDLRVVAATNLDLTQLIEKKQFRRDLFYRLNVYSIHLQPLRERRKDILPLAEHFLTQYAKTRRLQTCRFSQEAMDRLYEYDYPGNARELLHIVERAAILCRADAIMPEHLGLIAGDTEHHQPRVQCYERERIRQALSEAKWNRRKAARLLDMPYSTLRYKINKLKIN